VEYILNDMEAALKMISSNRLLAVDTETYSPDPRFTGLDTFNAKIRLLQIGSPTGVPVLLDSHVLDLMPAIEALQRPGLTKVMHNKKFDMKMIRSNYGVWLRDCHCTMLMYKLIGVATGFTSARTRKFNLKAMMLNLMDIPVDKTEQSSDWGGTLSQSQLEYAALDVGHPDRPGSLLLECYRQMKTVLYAPLRADSGAAPDQVSGYGMARSHQIDERAADVLAKVEYNGIAVDRSAMDAYLEANRDLVQDKINELVMMLNLGYQNNPLTGNIVVSEDSRKLLNNPKQLVKHISSLLNRHGGSPLTDLQAGTLEEVLKELREQSSEETESSDSTESDEWVYDLSFNIKLIDNLLQYKKAAKLISMGYENMLHPTTGCMHASFHEIGTATDRMSSGGRAAIEGVTVCNAQQISNQTTIIPVSRLSAQMQDKYPSESLA
jgi:DNA polymerase I-like protein with 3'-5' exonuclease and polymerase domains